MPSTPFNRRRVIAILAVALVTTGGLAYAGIPGGDGSISACYSKSNGALRVIDAEAGATCSPNKELSLSWNQRGPQGIQGPQGVAGPVGPQGPPGPFIRTRAVRASTSVADNSLDGYDQKFEVARCAPGEVATGGGYEIHASRPVTAQVTVTGSSPGTQADEPGAPPDAWVVFAIAPTGVGDWTLNPIVMCATPEP